MPDDRSETTVLAAHLSGARLVILPKKNEKDLRDIPEEIRKQMRLVLVDSMDQVLEAALRRRPRPLTKSSGPSSTEEPSSDAPGPRSQGGRRPSFPPTDQPPVVVQGG